MADEYLEEKEYLTNTEFWMVMRSEQCNGYDTMPTKRHETEAAAIEEAKRLAKKEGCEFFVLKAIGYVELPEPPVSYIKLFKKGEDNAVSE